MAISRGGSWPSVPPTSRSWTTGLALWTSDGRTGSRSSATGSIPLRQQESTSGTAISWRCIITSSLTTCTAFAANASVSWDLRDAADLLEVRWDWEDDGVWDEPWSTEKTATHGYPLPGAYQIRMVLRDTAGLTDDAVMTATVADAPPTAVARASSSSTLLRVPVLFDALNSSDDVGITAYRWDFGDGGSDTRATVTHAYAARGSFVATLTVWDASTQAGSDIVTILVASNADPTAVAMVSPASTGTTDTDFSFDAANSTDPEGIVATWDWAFGDGAVA